MRNIVFCLLAILPGYTSYDTKNSSALPIKDKNVFKLNYFRIGFGQNRYYMQPAFKVEGTKFVYTYQEVWGMPGQKLQCDTHLMGNFRNSSIDSISDLVKAIKDTVIHKTNIHFMGGAEDVIEISTALKKIRFELFNTKDTTASKIMDVIHTYMSGEQEKLQRYGPE